MFYYWLVNGYLLIWSRILHAEPRSQVSVSSSAAASVKYPPPGSEGSPQAYISSLSAAKADPNIPVTVVDGVAVTQPKSTWGYRETPDAYGPENWPKIAPKCAGSNQSPINIVTGNAHEKNIESPISISMEDPTGAGLIKGTLMNTGKTIGFTIAPNSPPVKFIGEITNGNSFILQQFHLHFGCEGKKGSEHTIDGQRYSGEIHLVFKNQKYASSRVAMQQGDGLLILAFFLEARAVADPNPVFDKIANNMPNIQFAKQKIAMPGGLSFVHLIPPLREGLVNLKRYVYRGSLPTPPCYESVLWVVFNRVIGIKPPKLPQKIFGDTGSLLCDNYRPLNDLNGREVSKYTTPVATTAAPSNTPKTTMVAKSSPAPTKSPKSRPSTKLPPSPTKPPTTLPSTTLPPSPTKPPKTTLPEKTTKPPTIPPAKPEGAKPKPKKEEKLTTENPATKADSQTPKPTTTEVPAAPPPAAGSELVKKIIIL